MATDSLRDLGDAELFPLSPNWQTSPAIGFFSGRETIQYNMGVVSIRNLTPYNARTVSNGYFLKDKQEEFDLLSFFHSHRGRLNRFWLPINFRELKITQDIFMGDDYFYIQDNGFYDVAKYYERVLIRLKDGSLLTRKIKSSASRTCVRIKTAFEYAISAAQIESVSLVILARFDQDDLEISYLTTDLSEVSILFKELPNEYSEVVDEATSGVIMDDAILAGAALLDDIIGNDLGEE